MESDPISTGTSPISDQSHSTQNNPIVSLNLPIATKLERDNYLSWQSQITPLLHGYGLYQFLEVPSPSPTIVTATGQTRPNESFLSWHKHDQLLLGWLRSSLTPQILAQVVSAKTSAELWSTLQRSFSATSRARLSELRHRLQNTPKENLTCAEYVQKLKSIADELAFIGSPVFDEDLMMYILHGLGPEYDPFTVAANTSSSRLSITDLQALLLSHEALLNSRLHSSGNNSLPSISNPTAYYSNPGQYKAQRNYKNKNKPPKYSGFIPGQPGNNALLPTPSFRPPGTGASKTNFSGASAPKQNKSYNPDRDTVCQICSQRGHTAKGCWYRYDEHPEDTAQPPFQAHVAQLAGA